MLDSLLEKAGLKYEDLKAAERETLNSWMEALQKNEVSLPKVKDYISSMREAIEQELCKTNNNTRQDIFLKARLRNYLLLEAFLSTPEKAKEQIENVISGLMNRKV